MTKDLLLKSIAEIGYNVGFGAKKHFATYDIETKLPGTIGFISMAIGVLALVFDVLSAKWLSATLIIAGLGSLYINSFNKKKQDYQEIGAQLTSLFGDLRELYRDVQSGADIDEAKRKLKSIDDKFQSISISDQIALSDWYAHYKFFEELQIDWIEEQKGFTWRDKWPLSLLASIALVPTLIIAIALITAFE